MVKHHCCQGDFVPPIPSSGSEFPKVQYTDDTLLVMQACESQLLLLKKLLVDFSRAIDLRVNYAKSCMVPINILDDLLNSLAAIFGCLIGSLPFAYLGLPLGTSQPSMNDLTPLMSHIEWCLNASANFLGYGGHLKLVNSILLTLSMYFMCSLKLPKGFITFCDRARRHCLWAKKTDDGIVSCHSLAAWSMVCKPKQHGSLGLLNLQLQNEALLLKQLHKFYSKQDVSWVNLVWSLYEDEVPRALPPHGSFWWCDIISLVHIYRSITSCQIGNGATVLFWKDRWS